MKKRILILLIMLIMSTPLYANAGSPMMWFGLLHLFFINLLIGLFETKIINFIYKINLRYSFIIIANYLSMFVGLYFIAPYFSNYGNNNDFWGGQTGYGSYEILGFYLGFSASVLSSIIIEMPFYLLSNKENREVKTALKYSITANIISNIVMFIIYFLIVFPGSK